MTPLLPTPDHYIQNLIAMNSSMSKKLWRKALKEHFDCTCVYCGETYELSNLTLDHVIPAVLAERPSRQISYQPVRNVIRKRQANLI